MNDVNKIADVFAYICDFGAIQVSLIGQVYTHAISYFWSKREADSVKTATDAPLVPADDDYREEVGQCACANTFNRAFRGWSCRLASSCISVKNSFSPASSL